MTEPVSLKCDCPTCDNDASGVFAIGNAPVSLALCDDHTGAFYHHPTQSIVWDGVLPETPIPNYPPLVIYDLSELDEYEP